MNSRIVLAQLSHARRIAHEHAFRYTFPMLWIDLDELPVLNERHRLFGYNRKRLLAIHDTDYLDATPRPIKDKLAALLEERGISLPAGGRVVLLTCARYFNYAFNPVSFYLAYGPNRQLAFVVSEVNNTFDEKHLYVLDEPQRRPTSDGHRYVREKAFHVSPFMDLAGHYDFHFRFPPDGLDIAIDLVKAKKEAFHARLIGHFSPFTSTSLAATIARYPFSGLLTMTRIIAQAAKLYGRGAAVYERPHPTSDNTVGRRPAVTRPPWSARLVFGTLSRFTAGRLQVTLPNRETRTFGDATADHVIEWHIHEWRVMRRLVTDGDIGLGETFMNGDWTTNDLTGFIRLLLDNKEAVESVEDGARFRQWGNRLLSWYRRNNVVGSRRNIAAHYDLSNHLFEQFLDPTMTYSGAYFENDTDSLEEAQQAKYRRLCDKIRLSDGDHVLEIGCGWGGFACYAARHASCKVTAVTISQEQYTEACARVERAGLSDRVTVLLQDYRSLTGAYDKIVSIEMFEAVGYEYFPAYFQAIERLLKNNGLFAMQVITIPDREFHMYRKSYDWIRKYIFPGGLLPSVTTIAQTATQHSRLVVQDMENIGIHYARTLALWRDRFNANLQEVRALGFDIRFERMWNFYLGYCEAAFAARYLGNLQLVFARPQHNGPMERVGQIEGDAA